MLKNPTVNLRIEGLQLVSYVDTDFGGPARNVIAVDDDPANLQRKGELVRAMTPSEQRCIWYDEREDVFGLNKENDHA
ncbi:hypothetical protein KNU84_gp037 [Bacteriophage DSS3_VP1]|uniref:Uncharacterized protein n=1 Tax=Bacteriophage DSS3_VP1 TaxID=2664196 RepID=A0A7S5FQJ6_9CAUD|nr:hypothetical protein KNU84_gp037 [Bacteriophage DSS3_VP1]QGH74667.1 hypothetical protein DSS3VP1_00099 [Bacteriophage DSS3_VP1]